MLPRTTSIWQRDSQPNASGKPGAVHTPAPADGSIRSLTKAYRRSAEFSLLRQSTRLDYERTLDLIDAELGDEPYRFITTKMVKQVRDELAVTPRKAHKFKQMVSRLYTWAAEDGRVKDGTNPAAKFAKLKTRQRTIMPWSNEEIYLFLSNAPPHLRLAVTMMLYTGQRVEDVATMEWSQYQTKFIRVRQSKTGEPLEIAVHPNLRTLLDPVTIRRGRICKSAAGRPYTANALRKAISDQCAAIDGMPPRSSHGLRYAAAGMLEEAGCTIGEISSIIGHRTYQMAMKYLNARRQSVNAMERLASDCPASING